MARDRRHRTLLRSSLMLLLFPFSIASIAYALFSQNLSISATTSSVSYVSNQSILMTYTKTQSGASPYTYSFSPMTIKNNGTQTTSVWQVNFTVPADTASISCPTTVICSLSGTTMTVLSNTNGTIAAGGSVTFTFSFTTATAGYTLQDVVTYANYTSAFATTPGLTVNTSRGNSTRSGQNYLWPVTVTVTNNTGQPLMRWRVTISPSSNYTVSGLPAGVTKTGTTTIILTSTNELATSASVTFTFTVNSARNATWNITSATVQGKG